MLTASFLSDLSGAWERSQDTFWPQAWIFLSLTLRGLGLALLLGIPAGVLLTRLPRLATPVIGVLAILQTIPSLILLALAIPILRIGEPPVLFAAVVYSLFPIIMNTYIGVTQVAPAIRDSARGMGMTALQVLWNVELPLAFPVVMAGVRTGAIYASAMVVTGALIGAGGLGTYVFNGMRREDSGLIWLGTLPILAFTLLLFWSLGGLASLSKRSSALGMSVGGGLIVLLSGYAAFGIVDRVLRPTQPELVQIGARDFTEGQILAEIVKQTLESQTRLKVEITGELATSVALTSLRSGSIDLYPEYTGNLLTNPGALGMSVPEDRSTITALVRKEMRRRYGLVLLEPFGLNNTYAPCVELKTARRFGLRKISDLARTPQLRVVIDTSFFTRPDGWNGMIACYDLHFDQPPIQIDPDLLYRALAIGEADVVIGFATAWQIDAQKLVVLEDDRGYFPSYHAAPLVRADVLERHPEVQTALGRLAGKIDDETMRRLNYAVAREKREPAEVARRFLQDIGILEAEK